MTENSGFASYTMFNAIKQHFTSKYDYFKYKGKVKLTQDHFLKDNGKYSYYKLSRKYNMEDLQDFYVSNFIDRNIKWVGELTNEEGESTFLKWKKRNQSLTYLFTENLEYLFDKVEKPDKILAVRSGNFPMLLSSTMEGAVSVETLCILNNILNFFPMWEKKIDDDIIFPEWKRKAEKYTPFIDFDQTKYKNILKELMKNYE